MVLRNVVCCSIAVLVLTVFLLPAKSQNRDDGTPSNSPKTVAESDVQWNIMRVAHENARLHVLIPESVTSDKIPLTVIMQHRGSAKPDFQVGETGYLLDCKMTVIGDDGKPVP